MGSKYSRFSDFTFNFNLLKEYIFTIFNPRRHYVGHNPAASYVVIAMLCTVILVVISGILLYGIQENHGVLAFLHESYFKDMKLFKEVHEFFVNLLLFFIALHVGGVLTDRFLHKEERVLASIVDGYKNIEGKNTTLSFTQKVVAFVGIGGAIALFVYTLSIPENPLVKRYNVRVDYQKVAPIFAKECGSCHTLYPPTLLPKESWSKLMSDLPNHFGDDASLDDHGDHASILAYLLSHSAQSSHQEMSLKMMNSLKNFDTIAITKTPFWKKTHREIPADVFKSETVKSSANCKACHSDIEQGTVEDDAIKAI